MQVTQTGFEHASIWNNCLLLYDPNTKARSANITAEEYQKAISKFNSLIGDSPKFNIWYDIECKKIFGADQTWINSDTQKSSFISPPSEFLISEKSLCNSPTARDLKFVLSYYGNHFGKDIVANEEIIYSNHPRISKFKNSKILVVAGGPTAKERNWNPNNYDYVFSCNHFFLNDKMKKINVDFAIVGGEVDMNEQNVEFHKYMENNNTLLCFEDRTSDAAATYFKMMKTLYGNRCVYAHSRYRGKPGTGLRLLCYAILFGAKEIDFVGIDGMSKDTKLGDLHNHAFQPAKKYSHKSLNYDVYRRHYVLFWDYIINNLKLHKKIKFQNLGEGHEKNQTTPISKHFFPLEK